MIHQSFTPLDQIWDLCIIGSGPVGMALALECESLGRNVLVLESGGSRIVPKSAEDSRAVIIDPRRHASMSIAVCRAFGGTSWTWGGRCVAFDDVDFSARPHVPLSEWPLDHDVIKPWYTKAAEYLLCGNDRFQSEPGRVRDLGTDVSASFLERWSTERHVALAYRDRITRSERITVCLNSTVTDLDLGERGQSVERVVVATPDGKSTVKARQVVLAAGGIETTRLLLAVQRRWLNHFGGAGGPLGRYYMGHISGKIATIVFDDPKMIDDFDYEPDQTGACARRRFMLTASAQREHQLLNTAFWPDNPLLYDPRHRSGVLSTIFLALALPPLGRRLLSEAIRLAYVGHPPRHYRAHLRNVLIGLPGDAKEMFDILRNRFLAKPRRPGFILRTRGGRYALHYHGEQEPNPESRIVLTPELDRFGLPRVAVDLRYTESDVRSVVVSHRILDSALRANAVGRLDYWYPEERLLEHVMEQAGDGVHQVGTTRMGQDPKDSVVDTNLKTHSVANLFVASSSIFPSSGQANPTFLATAFAVRLAHHLEQMTNERAYSVLSDPSRAASLQQV